MGPSTWTVPNYLALYACWQAGENSSWRGAGGLPEEHRKASCSLFPRPLHGRGRHSDRPWATKHPAAAWSTATRRCRFSRRLARLIAIIGYLPAISVIVSDSRGRLPFAGRDPAEWDPPSASPRRRTAITRRRHMPPDVTRSQHPQQDQGHCVNTSGTNTRQINPSTGKTRNVNANTRPCNRLPQSGQRRTG